MAYPQPMTVVGQLGQYGHHAALHNPVTSLEIKSELNSRGYRIQEHIPVEEKPLTREMAIKIAVDYSIDAFNIRWRSEGKPQIPRTANHWYRCPSGVCYVAEDQWDYLSTWAAMVANGYLNKEYGIPDWAKPLIHSSLSGLRGLGSTSFALGGFSDWIQENPWFVTTIGNLFTTYGQHLTAKQVSDALKASVPTNYLKKEDLASILAALQQQGVIQPGQEKAAAEGVKAATTPTWMMPAMIGGFALMGILLLQKK